MATTDPRKDIKDVNEELGYLEDQLLSISDRLSGSIKDAIRDIREESQGVSQIFGNNLTKSIREIARGSEAILGNTLKLAQGTAKVADIQKTQQVLQLKQLSAQRNLNTLLNAGLITEDQKAKAEQEILESIGGQNALLADQLNYAERIQKNLGVTGGILKGIAKIPVLGNFLDAESALAAAQRKAAQEGTNRTKVMGAAFKQLGSDLKKNLSDPLVSLGLLLKTFSTLYKIGTEFSSKTFELQKNLGLTTAQAKGLSMEFMSMQQTTNDLFANYNDLTSANNNLNESLGTSATFSADVLATQAKLMQVTGLAAEESAKLYEYSLLTGQSQEAIYDGVGRTNKGVLNNKKVLQEVLKTSGQLAAQYRNNPTLIAQAVIQTQKLGINLEQAKNMASGLLNFEDSISAELEAELLTGQELNLEKARALALQGKTAEAAAEMLKQTGGLAKFQSMNVLQQDALAKSMGLSTDELANSLVKAQQLEKLGVSERTNLTRKLDQLKANGEYEKAAELEKLALRGENVTLAEQQLDAQGKINKSVDSLTMSFKSMIAGPLESAANLISGLLETMAKNPIVKYLVGLAGGAAAAIAGAAAVMIGINGVKNLISGKPGETEKRPIFTKEVGGGGEGGGSSAIGDVAESLGGGKSAGIGKQLKTLVKNPKVMARALRRSGGGSMLKGLAKGGLKRIPMLGALLGAGMEFADGGFNMESVGRAALSGGGSFLGGLGGSALLPGVGTVAGGMAGGMAGDALGDMFFGERPEVAEDFIMRPGQKPLKFRKDDIIMGGTSLAGNSGGGDSGEVVSLLRELIAATKQGKPVHLDGQKVNSVLGQNLYTVGG
jgi:hypothetical protein